MYICFGGLQWPYGRYSIYSEYMETYMYNVNITIRVGEILFVVVVLYIYGGWICIKEEKKTQFGCLVHLIL